MDPIYVAYISLKRYDFKTVAQQTEQMLQSRADDQYAMLMKMQAVIEDSYFDETEFEESALDKMLDQTKLDGVGGALDLSMPTSFRPGSRLQSGYVRPLTAAVGRPGTRTSSRLGTGRIATAKLQSRAGASHLSRMGTAAVQNAQQQQSVESLPENYGAKPLFRRILPNYFLRLQQSVYVKNDIVPNPRLALAYLQRYQQESGSDWFLNDRAARCFYLLKQYEEAERHLLAASRLVPREETVLKQINCLACRGMREQTLEQLKQASDNYPLSTRFLLQAARISEFQQDYTTALTKYQEVLKLSPLSEEALAGCSALCAERHDDVASPALQMSLLLLQQRPDDPSAWNNAAVCLMVEDRVSLALSYLLTALQKCRSAGQFSNQRLKTVRSHIVCNVGQAFAKISDLQAAQDCFELSSQIDPTNEEAVNNLGVLCTLVQQNEKAYQLFNRADQSEVAKENKTLVMTAAGNFEDRLTTSDFMSVETIVNHICDSSRDLVLGEQKAEDSYQSILHFIATKDIVVPVANGIIERSASEAFDSRFPKQTRIDALAAALEVVDVCLTQGNALIQQYPAGVLLSLAQHVFVGSLSGSDRLKSVYVRVANNLFRTSFDNAIVQMFGIVATKISGARTGDASSQLLESFVQILGFIQFNEGQMHVVLSELWRILFQITEIPVTDTDNKLVNLNRDAPVYTTDPIEIQKQLGKAQSCDAYEDPTDNDIVFTASLAVKTDPDRTFQYQLLVQLAGAAACGFAKAQPAFVKQMAMYNQYFTLAYLKMNTITVSLFQALWDLVDAASSLKLLQSFAYLLLLDHGATNFETGATAQMRFFRVLQLQTEMQKNVSKQLMLSAKNEEQPITQLLAQPVNLLAEAATSSAVQIARAVAVLTAFLQQDYEHKEEYDAQLKTVLMQFPDYSNEFGLCALRKRAYCLLTSKQMTQLTEEVTALQPQALQLDLGLRSIIQTFCGSFRTTVQQVFLFQTAQTDDFQQAVQSRLLSLLTNSANFTTCVFALASLYKAFGYNSSGDSMNFLISHLDGCDFQVQQSSLAYLKQPFALLLSVCLHINDYGEYDQCGDAMVPPLAMNSIVNMQQPSFMGAGKKCEGKLDELTTVQKALNYFMFKLISNYIINKSDILSDFEGGIRYDQLIFHLILSTLSITKRSIYENILKNEEEHAFLCIQLLQTLINTEFGQVLRLENETVRKQMQHLAISIIGMLGNFFSTIDVVTCKSKFYCDILGKLYEVINGLQNIFTKINMQVMLEDEQTLLDSNLQLLTLSFFTLLSRLRTPSIFEINTQIFEPLSLLMYSFCRFGDMFKSNTTIVLAKQFRLFLQLSGLIEQEMYENPTINDVDDILRKISITCTDDTLQLCALHLISNVIIPSFQLINKDLPFCSYISTQFQNLLVSSEMKVIIKKSDKVQFITQQIQVKSIQNLSEYEIMQLFFSTLSIISTIQQHLPQFESLAKAAVLCKSLSTDSFVLKQISIDKYSSFYTDIINMIAADQKINFTLNSAKAIDFLFNFNNADEVKKEDSLQEFQCSTEMLSNLFPLHPVAISLQIFKNLVLIAVGVIIDVLQYQNIKTRNISNYISPLLQQELTNIIGYPAFILNTLFLFYDTIQQNKSTSGSSLYKMIMFHDFIKQINKNNLVFLKHSFQIICYNKLQILTKISSGGQGLEKKVKLGNRDINSLILTTDTIKDKDSTDNNIIPTSQDIDQSEIQKLSCSSAGEYASTVFQISLCILIFGQCLESNKDVCHIGPFLVELFDFAQSQWSEKQKLLEIVNASCLSIYQNKNENVIKMLATYQRSLLDFKQGVNSYQDFYNCIFDFAFHFCEMNSIAMLYPSVIRLISKLLENENAQFPVLYQDERLNFINKLFSKLQIASNQLEYKEQILHLQCIVQLFEAIDLKRLAGSITSDKQLKQQIYEEKLNFEQYLETLTNIYIESADTKVSKSDEYNKSKCLGLIQQSITALMRYFFDECNIAKIAHYAFSDISVLRDCYLKLQVEQSWKIKQSAIKQEQGLNLAFFAIDVQQCKQKLALVLDIEILDDQDANDMETQQTQIKEKQVEKDELADASHYIDIFRNKDFFPFPTQYSMLAAMLVMDPSLTLMNVISECTPACDMDIVSQAVYNIFSYLDSSVRESLQYTEIDYQMPKNHQLNLILRKALYFEIQRTPTPETLLRTNSMATKLIWQYTKLQQGVKFLHNFCRPIIGMILSRKTVSFPTEIIRKLDLCRFQSYFNKTFNDVEIDPSKIKLMLPVIPHDQFPSRMYKMLIKECLIHNVNVLIQLCQNVFNFILTNSRYLPESSYEIASMILKFTQEKFPGNVVAIRSAVSGFFFLRFICPSLASPDSDVYKIIDPAEDIILSNYDLVKDPLLKQMRLPKAIDAQERRRLILVTKIVQNLANGVLFGAKEKFMLPFNELIHDCIMSRNLFIDALAANVHDVYIEPNNTNYLITETIIENILMEDEESESNEQDTAACDEAAAKSVVDFSAVTQDQAKSQVDVEVDATDPFLLSLQQHLLSVKKRGAKIVLPHSFESLLCMQGLFVLHDQMFKYLSNIKETMIDSYSKQSGKQVFTIDDFTTLMNLLGQPIDANKKLITTQTQPNTTGQIVQCQKLDDIFVAMRKLTKEQHIILQHIKQSDLFYQFGESTQFKPVFYFILQRMNVQNFVSGENVNQVTLQLLSYHMITTIYPFLAQKIDIVLDFTQATLYDHICAMVVIETILSILPAEVKNNFNKIYILHPSQNSRITYSKFAKIITSDFIKSRVSLCDSLQKLQQFVPQCNIALPIETKTFIDSISMIYPNIQKDGNKILIAQNASGIILMYQQNSILVSKSEAKSNKEFQYCSMDFIPYSKFKIIATSEDQKEKNVDFQLIESLLQLNDYSYLSEANMDAFISSAYKNCTESKVDPNFGISESNGITKKITLLQTSQKQLRVMMTTIQRIQQTISSKSGFSKEISNIQKESINIRIQIKQLQKYKQLSHVINPVFLLAMSLLGLYHSDIKVRILSLECLNNTFASLLSLHFGKLQEQFDETDKKKIAYLSKQGISQIVSSVLVTIQQNLPETSMLLVHALISIVNYVSTRDVLILILEQLLLTKEMTAQPTLLSCNINEIVVVIKSLIIFVAKYPDISDQSITILKSLCACQVSGVNFLNLCFQECLSLLQQHVYDTHTIIFIFNSFVTQSDEIKQKATEFLINQMFMEVFIRYVSNIKISPLFSNSVQKTRLSPTKHQLVLDSPIMQQIIFCEPRHHLNVQMLRQLLQIVQVLQTEGDAKYSAQTKLMLVICQFMANEDKETEWDTSYSSPLSAAIARQLRGKLESSSLTVVGFMCEQALRQHGSQKQLVKTRSQLLAVFASLVETGLVQVTRCSNQMLIQRLLDACQDYALCLRYATGDGDQISFAQILGEELNVFVQLGNVESSQDYLALIALLTLEYVLSVHGRFTFVNDGGELCVALMQLQSNAFKLLAELAHQYESLEWLVAQLVAKLQLPEGPIMAAFQQGFSFCVARYLLAFQSCETQGYKYYLQRTAEIPAMQSLSQLFRQPEIQLTSSSYELFSKVLALCIENQLYAESQQYETTAIRAMNALAEAGAVEICQRFTNRFTHAIASKTTSLAMKNAIVALQSVAGVGTEWDFIELQDVAGGETCIDILVSIVAKLAQDIQK